MGDQHYEYNEIGEGLDLNQIIADNEYFSSISNSIKDTLTRLFQKAYKYSEVFIPYLNTYKENQLLGT